MADKHYQFGSTHIHFESLDLIQWVQESVGSGLLVSTIQTLPFHLHMLGAHQGIDMLLPASRGLHYVINTGLTAYTAYHISDWVTNIGTDLWYQFNPFGSELPGLGDLRGTHRNETLSHIPYYPDRVQSAVDHRGDYHLHIPIHFYHPKHYLSFFSSLPQVIRPGRFLNSVAEAASLMDPASIWVKPLMAEGLKHHFDYSIKKVWAKKNRLPGRGFSGRSADLPNFDDRTPSYQPASASNLEKHSSASQRQMSINKLMPYSAPLEQASGKEMKGGQSNNGQEGEEKEGSLSYLLTRGSKGSAAPKRQGGGTGGGGDERKQPPGGGKEGPSDAPAAAVVVTTKHPFMARMRIQSEQKIVEGRSAWPEEKDAVLREKIGVSLQFALSKGKTDAELRQDLLTRMQVLGVYAQRLGSPSRGKLTDYQYTGLNIQELRVRVAQIQAAYPLSKKEHRFAPQLLYKSCAVRNANGENEKWVYDLLAIAAELGSARACYLYLDEKISEFFQLRLLEENTREREKEVYYEIKFYLHLFFQLLGRQPEQKVAPVISRPPVQVNPAPPPGFQHTATLRPRIPVLFGSGLVPQPYPPVFYHSVMPQMQHLLIPRAGVPLMSPAMQGAQQMSISMNQPDVPASLPPPQAPPVSQSQPAALYPECLLEQEGIDPASIKEAVKLSDVLVEESEEKWEQVIFDAIVEFNKQAKNLEGKVVLTGGRAVLWYAKRHNIINFFLRRTIGWADQEGKYGIGDWDLQAQNNEVAEKLVDFIDDRVKKQYPGLAKSLRYHPDGKKKWTLKVAIGKGEHKKRQAVDVIYEPLSMGFSFEDSDDLPVVDILVLGEQLSQLIKDAREVENFHRVGQLLARKQLLEEARVVKVTEKQQSTEAVDAGDDVEVETSSESESESEPEVTPPVLPVLVAAAPQTFALEPNQEEFSVPVPEHGSSSQSQMSPGSQAAESYESASSSSIAESVAENSAHPEGSISPPETVPEKTIKKAPPAEQKTEPPLLQGTIQFGAFEAVDLSTEPQSISGAESTSLTSDREVTSTPSSETRDRTFQDTTDSEPAPEKVPDFRRSREDEVVSPLPGLPNRGKRSSQRAEVLSTFFDDSDFDGSKSGSADTEEGRQNIVVVDKTEVKPEPLKDIRMTVSSRTVAVSSTSSRSKESRKKTEPFDGKATKVTARYGKSASGRERGKKAYSSNRPKVPVFRESTQTQKLVSAASSTEIRQPVSERAEQKEESSEGPDTRVTGKKMTPDEPETVREEVSPLPEPPEQVSEKQTITPEEISVDSGAEPTVKEPSPDEESLPANSPIDEPATKMATPEPEPETDTEEGNKAEAALQQELLQLGGSETEDTGTAGSRRPSTALSEDSIDPMTGEARIRKPKVTSTEKKKARKRKGKGSKSVKPKTASRHISGNKANVKASGSGMSTGAVKDKGTKAPDPVKPYHEPPAVKEEAVITDIEKSKEETKRPEVVPLVSKPVLVRSPSPEVKSKVPQARVPDNWFQAIRRADDRFPLGAASISHSPGFSRCGCNSLSEYHLGQFLERAGASLLVDGDTLYITVEAEAVQEEEAQVPDAIATIPDLSYLSARLLSWDINSLDLFQKLYSARYFHQALPYLASILLDPDSTFFNPYLLGAIITELLGVDYPRYRLYDVKSTPGWPVASQLKSPDISRFILSPESTVSAVKKMHSKLRRTLAQKKLPEEGVIGFLDAKGVLTADQKEKLIDLLKANPETSVRNWLLYRLQQGSSVGAEERLGRKEKHPLHHLDIALRKTSLDRYDHYQKAQDSMSEALLGKEQDGASEYARNLLIYHEEIYLDPEALKSKIQETFQERGEEAVKAETEKRWEKMNDHFGESRLVNLHHYRQRFLMGELGEAGKYRYFSRLDNAACLTEKDSYISFLDEALKDCPDVVFERRSIKHGVQPTDSVADSVPSGATVFLKSDMSREEISQLYLPHSFFRGITPNIQYVDYLDGKTLVVGGQRQFTPFRPIESIRDLKRNDDDRLVLGMASILTCAAEQSLYEAEFVELLRKMNTLYSVSDDTVYLTADAVNVRKVLDEVEDVFIPELAFLKARLQPWDPSSLTFIRSLYRARYFHEAFPYLVKVMLDPVSPAYQPFTLAVIVAELVSAGYPAARKFKLRSFPADWPELSDQEKLFADQLLSGQLKQEVGLKLAQGELMDAVRTDSKDDTVDYGVLGLYHALEYFTEAESDQLVQELMKLPPAKTNHVSWLISHMASSQMKGSIEIYPPFYQDRSFQHVLDMALADSDISSAAQYFSEAYIELASAPGARTLPILLNQRVYQNPEIVQKVIGILLETVQLEDAATGLEDLASEVLEDMKKELTLTQAVNLHHQLLLLRLGALNEGAALDFFKRLVMAYRINKNDQYRAWLSELITGQQYQQQAQEALDEIGVEEAGTL